MIKVLIVSFEPWRDDTNEGNVLSNIFSGQDFEFAQIYCKPGEPQNKLCKNYFHMTTRMALRSIVKHKTCGARMALQVFPSGNEGLTISDDEDKKLYSFFKLIPWPIFYVLRDLIMIASHWKSDALAQWIHEFQPDVIFAPLYASQFMLALDRHVIRLANKPAVSYVSDDNYTLRQLRFSPVYWFDRLVLRRNVRKTVPFFSHVYTMTQEQAAQMQTDLGCDMRILRKSIAVEPIIETTAAHQPLRLIYAGGLGLGREDTLVSLVKAIRTLPPGSARLDIYTKSPLRPSVKKQLSDGFVSFLHEAIAYDILMERYRSSDIALHVESFRKKYALLTRLSFSTKIVDCLAGGCAVLAICPQDNAGFCFLQREDAAVCIHRRDQIEHALKSLMQNAALLQQYREKAHQCMIREFNPEKMQHAIQNSFEMLVHT